MNPAWSVIFFTTLIGAAQGLAITIAAAALLGIVLPEGLASLALALAFAMGVVGLGASFAHLGRPERAWRAVMMWRTSWLSREVIVMPAFLGVVALWWLALRAAPGSAWAAVVLPLAAVGVAALLWLCTAMIYACLRFIREWAHPLTGVNFTLIGLASGGVLFTAIAAVTGATELARQAALPALVATLLAWLTRTLSLMRNAGLKPASTLQSATGIRSERLVQRSMGMSAGAFNTREFFHGVKAAGLKRIRLVFTLFGFALPAGLLMWAIEQGPVLALVLAFPVQYAGLLAERWFFFAQARHPQNLYYQVVS